MIWLEYCSLGIKQQSLTHSRIVSKSGIIDFTKNIMNGLKLYF